MIVRQRSLNHILKSIKILNLILVATCFATAIYFLVSYYGEAEVKALPPMKKEGVTEEVSPYDRSAIGKGALSLTSEIHSFPFPDLSGDILFLAKNTRPDTPRDKMLLKVGLKENPNTLEIKPNQKLFLSYDDRRLNFSKHATPLWVEPKMDERGELWMKMGIELANSEGENLLHEVREFKINQSWEPKKGQNITDPKLREGLSVMEKGKWWGPDKLFEGYGGEDYQKYVGCQRLEIERENGKELLFLEEGETYVWKEGNWVRSVVIEDHPLGKVVSISPHKLEWRFWDATGMESTTLSFKREKEGPLAMRIEDVFTRLRKRTSSRISCRIDNRAKILKEGDWLVHTNSGWHTIKHFYEVEGLLNLDILGDLFIFDGIHNIEGKEIFSGTLFNPMRTEMKVVRLPLSQIKGGEHSPHTKNSFSARIGPLAHEENAPSETRGPSGKKFETIEELDLFEED